MLYLKAACPSDKRRIKIKMRADHWWIDTEKEKLKTLEAEPVPVPFCPRKIPGRPALKHAINSNHN
jgi:hypothetical protein